MRIILFITLSVALIGTKGFAQSSSNTVPGLGDYGSFSRFITERNIFNANRQPHHTSTHHIVSRPTTHSASAPAFSLVGTMSYEKGIFAFFNGNSDDLKKALLVSGKIADYTVANIDYGHVTLETTNQSDKIELKVGDVMREENGVWQLAAPGEVTFDTSTAAPTNSHQSSTSPGSSAGSGTTPPSTGEANDILKRLMERRAQENQ